MKKIKLIGIRGDENYETWRRKTKQALLDLNLDERFEEINQVDAILDYNISSIPALIINQTVLMEQNNHIPDKEEFINVILNFMNSQKMKIDNIIVPTDFSDPAKNAYLYARKMAEEVGAKVKVLHASYPDRNSLSLLEYPTEEELARQKQKELDNFVNDDPKNSIEREVAIGFPKEEILKRSAMKDADMILMGTSGSGGMMNKVFGSVSSEVSQKAECPVWLVPPGAVYNGIKNIMYAGNYESADQKMLVAVSELADKFDAAVHMVHVTTQKNFEENQIQELVLEKLFNKLAPELNFKMDTVINDTVWEGLDAYARKNNIDLIVIVTKHRTFWESLMKKSITKAMVFKTKVPMLILHTDDEG